MRFNTELPPHYSHQFASDIVGRSDIVGETVDPVMGDVIVAPDGEYIVTLEWDVVLLVKPLTRN